MLKGAGNNETVKDDVTNFKGQIGQSPKTAQIQLKTMHPKELIDKDVVTVVTTEKQVAQRTMTIEEQASQILQKNQDHQVNHLNHHISTIHFHNQ